MMGPCGPHFDSLWVNPAGRLWAPRGSGSMRGAALSSPPPPAAAFPSPLPNSGEGRGRGGARAAWGEDRYTWGTTPTTYRYTGQRVEAGIGLYYYGARWYDAALSRFVQADTVVPKPENPQGFNRFAYVRNNPMRYIDPLGNEEEEVTAEEIMGWDYDSYVKILLLEMLFGAQARGKGAVCGELLRFVRDYRPDIVFASQATFMGYTMQVGGGLTVPTMGGYTICLNPGLRGGSDVLGNAAILAHELGHAIINSRGVDSMEEEYKCNRVMGYAYYEMLDSTGAPKPMKEARDRYNALNLDKETWVGREWAAKQGDLPFHEWAGEVDAQFLYGLSALAGFGHSIPDSPTGYDIARYWR
jgi:RHS repeat-associated protein